VSGLRSEELFRIRGQIQFVFQHSAAAMNPDFTALEVVAEPIRIRQRVSGMRRREQALEIMQQVGIPPEWAERLPSEFSGGQRQRLAIARALILKPKVLILDEPLSGLDTVTQAQLTRLLRDLQTSLSVSYVLISHDLQVAAEIADSITVMHEGKIVESADTESIVSRPQHEQTRRLIESMPRLRMGTATQLL
ncbi:MAG: ATP-binding cassette domain-containing protein, partial [Acidobacteriaceae bacterium]|nr:ATP-binding cassette domain-containing protein [Acidobacteriaceae bacterium]